MNKIRVSICDDIEYLCINLRNFLKYSDEVEFAGYATETAKCISMVEESKPDILLLDIQMEPETLGIDLLPELKEKFPGLKIIMLTSFSDSDYIFQSLVNGASDYIVKSCSNAELVEKIKDVYENNNTISPEVINVFRKKTADLATAHKNLIFMLNKMITLSSNELEVLTDIYNGKTYNEIAQERFVENTTVRSMCSRILRKFQAQNMNELITNLRDMKIFDSFFGE